MSSVTYAFSTGNTISASEVNQNFADVVSLATAISAGQILGGITSDKLASKYAVAHDSIPLIPFTAVTDVVGTNVIAGGTGGATQDGDLFAGSTFSHTLALSSAELTDAEMYTFPAASTAMMDWFPVLNTGFKGYLTSIRVYCKRMVTGTGTTYPSLEFVLNDAITLGGAQQRLTAGNSTFNISSDVNPISQPLCALTDGDFIRIKAKSSDGVATDTRALGVVVTFTYKYELQQ